MTQVASSTVSVEAPQKDGRFWVTETLVLDDGSKQQYQYLAAAGTKTAAIASQRVTEINFALAYVPPPDTTLNAIQAALTKYQSGDMAGAKTLLDQASAAVAGK